MHLFYLFYVIYLWFFFLKFVQRYEYKIQRLYWVWEQPSLLFSKKFENLGYLEKLFLVFFYKRGMFRHSIANLFNRIEIIRYRQKKYPYIFLYHNYYDRRFYKINDLKFFIKLYKFCKNFKIFNKFNEIINVFFKNFTFNSKNKKLIFFLSFQKILISLYYNTLCKKIFFFHKTYNLLYFNFFFAIILNKCKKKIYFYNLNYYNIWYLYTFDNSLKKKKYKLFFSKWNLKLKKYFKFIKIYNLLKYLLFYHITYKLKKIIFSIKLNPSKALRKSVTIWPKINIKPIFYEYFKHLYPVRFKDTSNVKNVNYKNIENYLFFYLRKNKIFNKGRYSRNRQLYRTGVYWCLWLNVIIVYGLYFLFYRFSFNFGYVWIGMFFLILSTIFSRMFKYNFYNIFYLYNEFINLKNWLSLILYDLILNFQIFLKKKLYNYSIIMLYFKKRFIFFENIKENIYLIYFLNKLDKIFKTFWKSKKVYVWEYMGEDNSLFKYKTVLHFFKQVYRSMMV